MASCRMGARSALEPCQVDCLDEAADERCAETPRCHAELLESVTGASRMSRYSIIVLDPIGTIRAAEALTALVDADDVIFKDEDPLKGIRSVFELGDLDPTNHEEIEFQGGALGRFAYDIARRLEAIRDLGDRELAGPDAGTALYDLILYDHQDDVIWILVPNEAGEQDPSEDFRDLVNAWSYDDEFDIGAEFGANYTDDAYADGVDRLKDYLGSGDMYQVNLAQRRVGMISAEDYQLYIRLRDANPAPYMAYLDIDEGLLVASPERIILDEASDLDTRPIAGTLRGRPRAGGDDEDDGRAIDLLRVDKDRAERIMIVDLDRNDIARVGVGGSVKVREIMGLERYSGVMHLVSQVTGDLQEAIEAVDLIRAGFPGGTLTGAPKVRTMEIIDELEPQRRAAYCGSIGYIAYKGNIDFKIAIPTLYALAGQLFCQAGGGVVGDSVPDGEYRESFEKGNALIRGLEIRHGAVVAQSEDK
uniref:Aminodeoxychorismate synthase component 1 n=1 Tax=Streptomyces lividans TaxID=1916 RepID=PABB_STRLI|nr:RecName: Full=Aminodeoxychorismate synthase component 1; Short=ADC synthase; Short=ADCS; AltName: Full=4-amino-4-deoxychorismate synthase component 1 [Streptomyces lividans]AAA26798.1 putative [Streptomyces lividans]